MEARLGGLVADGSIHGYAVQIYDADDELLFESQAGTCATPPACPNGNPDYTVDLVTGVASSSKWVTSTTVLAALEREVQAGQLADLDSALELRTRDVLNCGGALDGSVGEVTIRQLLAFTDGLLPGHDCVGAASSTLQSCACEILVDSQAVAVDEPAGGSPKANAQPPGTVYKYGETHHVVAGAMIETIAGGTYESLFEELVKAPAGMKAFYRNDTNLAGSLQASVADYARFVRAVFHDGREDTKVLLSSAAVEQQQRSQMPEGVLYRITPQPGLEYGLNNWRWCVKAYDAGVLDGSTTPELDPSCDEVHQTGHGGKGGYQPWIDLGRGYYGVFAMREESAGGAADYNAEELAITSVARLYSGLVVDAAK